MSTPRPIRDAAAALPAAERKGQRTRRRILETARAVFAEVGYERATIRGIAAAAEVDKSSIIKYFGTKEALFREAALALQREPAQQGRPADESLGGSSNPCSIAAGAPSSLVFS